MNIRDRIKDFRRVPASELKPSPRNWRTHPQAQRDSLRGVLAEVGIAGACLARQLADGTLELIDGHLRAETLPDAEIPTLILDVDEAEAVKILATYDPLGAMAEADPQKLDEVLRAVQTSSEAVAAMLSDLWEANKPDEPPEPIEEDTPPEPQIDVVTRPGDLWTIDGHRLLCGDCRDPAAWERLLGGERVDSIVTDQPYGVDWDTDYTRFTSGDRNTKVVYPEIKGDKQPFDPSPWLNFETVVLWGANIFSARLPVGTWLIWDKREDNGTAWLADAEIAWMKGGYGVYICPHCGPIRENRGIHPTQKRVDVVAWTIEKSKAGQLIADPYCGSGTTMMACEHLGRRCFACEIEPVYVDVCLRRYLAKYPEASIVRHDGKTWEEANNG